MKIVSHILECLLVLSLLLCTSCQSLRAERQVETLAAPQMERAVNRARKVLAAKATPRERAVASAIEQTTQTFYYDAAYTKLAYPNGDVPIEKGVCTDVVIRAFRAAGVDLQKLVHEDMKANFKLYPNKWSLRATDTNIDHRRVPNLMKFFERKGKSLPVTNDANKFQAGDVVTWVMDNNLTHIGLVIDEKSSAGVPLIVHNIGAGARVEDVLFAWKITGHYRYFD